jgi:Amt family ammonium transporter
MFDHRSAFTLTVVNNNNQGETSMNRKWIALAVGAGCLLAGGSVLAQEGVTVAIAFYSLDNIVLLFSAVLVLFMQAGFAALESGMSPLNNTVNIMFKNFTDLCVGVLLFYTVGYSIMYGPDASGGLGLFGWDGFGISAELSSEPGPGVIHPQVDWLFQVAFAATAATIVSGAVVGRMQFRSYVYYSLFITALVYPISGFWKWGGGWLDQLGFYDFAGSIVVHAVGGFAALAAAMVIGPRIGRFTDDPEAPHLAGHSLATASLGVFILWIGWFGFNPGSQLAFSGEANIAAIMLIAVNTTLAAAAGAIAAMITSSILAHSHRVSLSMLLNGALAGLVGITANCDSVTNNEAIVIGLVAGILVVFGGLMLNKLKIDDAVGAWPVHGLCGVWGGIATGIFGGHALGVQILGSLVIPLWAFVTMFLFFKVLKQAGILRVTREEELAGLDIVEHGEREGE